MLTPSETNKQASTQLRALGNLCFGSVAVSLIWATRIALRLPDTAGAERPHLWLAMAGIALPLALVSVGCFRAAFEGIKRLIPDAEQRNLWHCTLALWAIAISGPLMVFGSVLKATTHHRGLGGTTFGIVAVAVILGLGLLTVRASHLFRRFLSRPAAGWSLTGIAGILLILLLRRPGGSAAHLPAGSTLAVIDGVLFVALSWGASMVSLPAKTSSGRYFAAMVACALLTVAGVGRLPRVASAGPEIRSAATIVSPLLDRWHVYEPAQATAPASQEAAPTVANASPSASATSATQQPVASAAPPPSASASASSEGTAKAPEKADVVLVTLDSVRADHVGSYGYGRATTPNLDEFARASIVFEHAYAAGPEPRTGLAPILTGLYLEQVPRDDRAWPTILDAGKTLAERLRDAGYATGAVASFRWLSEERGFTQGFDEFDESSYRKTNPEQHSTGEHTINTAIEVYDRLSAKKNPVFLWVHMFDAHARYLDHEGHGFGAEDVDHYDSEIAYLDEHLARLLNHVQKGKRANRTMLIVHGSHGEAFGEHGMTGHPGTVFEELIKVPLIVRAPWLQARRIKTEVVSTIDLAPTILEAAAAADRSLPGTSIVSRADAAAKPRGTRGVLVSFMGMERRPRVRAWVEPGYKLVVGSGNNEERVGLYELGVKDGETKDVSSTKSEVAKRMRGEMDAFLKERVGEVASSPKR